MTILGHAQVRWCPTVPSSRSCQRFDLDDKIDELGAVDGADPVRNAGRDADKVAFGDAPGRSPGDTLPAQFARFGFARTDQRTSGDESSAAIDHVPDIGDIAVNLGAARARTANDGRGIAGRT